MCVMMVGGRDCRNGRERESEGGRERRLYVKMYECVLVSSVR